MHLPTPAFSHLRGTACMLVGLTLLVALTGCERCDKVEEQLARDAAGRAVVSEFSACTSLGTTIQNNVYLVEPTGHRELIFGFNPNPGIVVPKEFDAPLTATWLPNGELQLSIGAVAGITVQKRSVGGATIRYGIGKII